MTAALRCCPTCGQSVEDVTGIYIDLDANMVTTTLGTVAVTPKEAELLHVLRGAMPGHVTGDRLVARIYGAGDMPEGNIINVLLSHVRKKISPIGLKIPCAGTNKKGTWRLILEGAGL